VTVTNQSPTTIQGWTVRWTLPSGQTISQVWNGTLTISGSDVIVTDASYNGTVAAGASTTFGLIANGSTASTSTTTCTAG
jgi:Cellulose binding domain